MQKAVTKSEKFHRKHRKIHQKSHFRKTVNELYW